MKKFFSLILCTLLTVSSVISQRKVSGVVRDADTGESLIGATILVSDTQDGVISDIDGAYTIDVPSGYDRLTFTYTGFEPQTVLIPENNILDVDLSAGQVLDEVVVVGYGEVRRKDVTGSLKSVDSKEFNKGAIASPQQLLAGKVAGVNIVTDGSPGGGSTIRIRGASSLNANNNPLIVIDGIPLGDDNVSGSRNSLNFINPNDVESMTVLKDASATAIYGNRASGGVILITTKKGSVGSKLKVSYNGNISSGSIIKQVDVLDTDEFRSLILERYGEGSAQAELLGNASTNWQDEIYQKATGMDHNLSVSGALKSLPYRASFGFTDMNGLLKRDNFNRLTTNVNINPRLLDNRLQLNLGVKNVRTNNNFTSRGAIGNALFFDPTQSVFDEDSQYGGYTTWTIANGNPNSLAPTNPVALIEQRDDNSEVVRTILSGSADYRFSFLPALRANMNLAHDRSKGSGQVSVPQNAAFAFDDINGGGVNNIYESENTNDLLEFYLNYKKEFGIHGLDLMGGYSWQHFQYESSFTNSDVNGTPAETTTDSNPAEYYLLSLFTRLNYDYNDKIVASLSLRRDGSSRFSPNNRWGLFPAAALAVKLIEDDGGFLNSLKLRAGYGVTGQQDIGDLYAYQGLYVQSNENALYQFGESFLPTFRPNGYDEEIEWEKSATLNLGADFSFIDNVLSGSIDVYNTKTTDLLSFIPLPAGSNLTNFLTTNVGNLENNGVEVALDFNPINKENLNVSIGINGAYNKTEITKLRATDDEDFNGILTGGIAGGVGSNIQIHTVDFAPSSFYVFEQLYDDDGNILEGEFVDRNEDGIVNDDDKYRFQKPAPDYIFGITSNIAIHDFDLSFAGRASIGNYMYNNVETNSGNYNGLYNSTGITSNIHQSAIDDNIELQSSVTFSDAYVRDASFFKLDHVTLGYTFNDLVGESVRVYSTLQNPLIITKYDGIDPEVFGGIDNTIYPRPRTLIVGLNVNF